jgi:hypothetical protein
VGHGGGKPLGVTAQPPLSKNSWGRWSASPLLRKRAQNPLLLLTVKIRQPSHEFTFGVGMSFILYPLVLTPVV